MYRFIVPVVSTEEEEIERALTLRQPQRVVQSSAVPRLEHQTVRRTREASRFRIDLGQV